ncbi:tetratricopeptide repeat protein [Fluviicola sp.]|uniref:tetratricopeptide repeat protein n=1 Tax=Fluviicola sp. TaxID=1917219 RepID=UPI003D2C98E1
MKTGLFVVITLLGFKLHAQLNLEFDKRFVECEDKWIAFKMDKDSSYNFGFIYIDSEAGLTFNQEGSFKMNSKGILEVKKMKETNVKYRLEANRVTVALIPKNLFDELEIDETPEWLKYYKTDLNTAERNYKWGFMYNGWNECEKALPFLLKAKELDPNTNGLAVEIAFSYNCLFEFEKAVEILEEANDEHPKDAYINKELIYSLTKLKEIEKAEAQFYKSIKSVSENTYHAENCFNIMQYYYLQKDAKNFHVWYDELKKWPNENEQITLYAKKMKAELK